jgi:ubiquinone/menaquinone biosynthesis C-methylase UbiE
MVHKEALTAVFENLPENGLILDVACGDFEYTKFIESYNPNVISFDIYKPDLTKSRKTRFLLASMEQLPFKNESFDFIMCLSSLQYIYDNKIVIQEFNRVLKKNGKVQITVPTSRSIFRLLRDLEIKYNVYRFNQYGIKHHHYYSLNDIDKFKEYGFSITAIYGYNFNFIPRLITFVHDIASKNLHNKVHVDIDTYIPSWLKHRGAAAASGDSHIRSKFHHEGDLELNRSIPRFFSEFAYHFIIIMEKKAQDLIVP